MAKRVLLIEPYESLVEVLGFFLEELGYQFDVVTDSELDESDLTRKPYECVLSTSIRTAATGAAEA